MKSRTTSIEKLSNLEAENEILSTLILSEDAEIKDDIFLELTEEDFYTGHNRELFGICRQLWSRKTPVDLITVTELLEKTGLVSRIGMMYLTGLMNVYVSSANYRYYLNILKANTAARLAYSAADRLKEGVGSNPMAAIDSAVRELTQIGETTVSSLDDISAAAEETYDYIENSQRKRYDGAVKTPYRRMNYYLGGLQNGEVIVFAARPGVGKSAIVSEILLNSALEHRKRVAYFNLEMNKRQIVLRMYANLMGTSIRELTCGKYDRDRLTYFKEKLRSCGMYVDDTSFQLEQIVKACRVLKKRSGLDLVCVDYLQLVGTREKFKDRRVEVDYVSRHLKLLAKELNVPVLALSQLNRESEKSGQEPTLADLRESGAIEQDASQVVFLYRETVKEEKLHYEPDTERYIKMIVAKNRQGASGDFYLKFQADRMRFVEIEKDGRELPRLVPLSKLEPCEQTELPWR